MPSFRLGDHGSAVAEIRSLLINQGLLRGSTGSPGVISANGWTSPDAVFDAATDHAVRAFQQQRGLLVDGIVGDATYRVLRESSYHLGTRVLLYRLSAPMVGDDVATLQSRLQNLGYYTSIVDGIFAETTHNALCLYQGEYGLSPDGICGPATLRSLERLGTRITGGSPHAIREEERVRRSGPRLTGKRIVIDPGSGSGHTNDQHAAFEAEVLWDLASRLEGRMSAAGMQTFLSHDGRGRPSDEDRARVANAIDADIVLSLRCASSSSDSASGVATFYFGNAHGSSSMIGRNLSSFIQREIVARTGLADCRTHQRTWDILRLTRMPVSLIDVGYLTNPDDTVKLTDPRTRDVIAEAIVVAVKRLYLMDDDDRPTGTYTFADLLAAEEVAGTA